MGLTFLAALAFHTEAAWWNYPGLELWKFLNLIVFVGAGFYLFRRPVTDGFASRREGIRRRFLSAKEQMEEASAKLVVVELRLAHLGSDVGEIKLQSKAEAAAEGERMAAETEGEVQRYWQRAERDIERLAKAARREAQKVAAQEYVSLAREMVRGRMGAEDDARLIMLGVEDLGRSRR